jgi:RND family efflux transporter MFP subunit
MTSIVPILRGRAVAAAGLSLLALLGGCRPKPPPPPPPPAVEVAAAIERDLSDWDEFTGRIEPVESVRVRPRVTGYIDRVAFEEGSYVKKGALLFEIDPRPYRAALARAEADLTAARTRAELARNEVVRADRLLSARAISQEEYDERVNRSRETAASVQAAEAAVQVARLDLDFTRVTAPISGRTGRAEVTVGNLVQSGANATLLTTVVSTDRVYVGFEGDEQVFLKYGEMSRRGDDPELPTARNVVLMGLSNEQGFPHEGHLVFVDNQLDPRTGTISGRAVFDNADGAFTPGLFARIKLVASDRIRAVLVRDRAIGTDQDQKFVMVIGPDDKAIYRPVKLGRVVDGLRIVKQGVKPGEVIVVNGLQRVRPGMTVKPTKVPMDPSAAATPSASTAGSPGGAPAPKPADLPH